MKKHVENFEAFSLSESFDKGNRNTQKRYFGLPYGEPDFVIETTDPNIVVVSWNDYDPNVYGDEGGMETAEEGYVVSVLMKSFGRPWNVGTTQPGFKTFRSAMNWAMKHGEKLLPPGVKFL